MCFVGHIFNKRTSNSIIIMATLTKTKLKTPLELFYSWEQDQANSTYLHQPIDGSWHTWTWKEAGEQIRKDGSCDRSTRI